MMLSIHPCHPPGSRQVVARRWAERNARNRGGVNDAIDYRAMLVRVRRREMVQTRAERCETDAEWRFLQARLANGPAMILNAELLSGIPYREMCERSY